jgi:type VI secretion system protein ImpL
MGALAGTFGVARQTLPSFSGQGRSYFLNRLFRDVVFKESGLAGTNFSLERKRLWLGRAGYASVGLLTLILGAAWFSSYATNSGYVDDVDRQLAELSAATGRLDPEQRELTAILPVLDQARAIPGATGAPPESSWIAHLGLYQGDKLGASAATAYRNLLDRAFLSRLIVRVEERIKTELRREQPDQQVLYDALKVYLMLDRSADRPYDPVFVERWMSRDWAADIAFDEAARQRLEGHLASLLEQLPDSLPLVPDQELIARARARLPGELNAEQIYRQLLRADHGIAEFRVSDVAGPDAAEVFHRISGAPLSSGVSGIFTQPGQVVFISQVQARVQELSDGDWVLAVPPQPEAELQRRSARVQELYWEDYCPQWEELLADLDTRAPRNTLQNAIDRLYMLSGPNSPLRSLLLAVVEQTRPVPQCLESLGDLVDGESPSGLDQLLTEIDELAVQLSPLAKAKAEGRNIERETANDVLVRLEQLPRGKPPPVDRWLRTLTEPVPIYLYEGLRAYINSVWRRDVLGSASAPWATATRSSRPVTRMSR